MTRNLDEFVAEFHAKEKELAKKSAALENATQCAEAVFSHLVSVSAGLEAAKRELDQAALLLRSELKSKRKTSPEKNCDEPKAVTVPELKNFLARAREENPSATQDELRNKVFTRAERAQRILSDSKKQKLEELLQRNGEGLTEFAGRKLVVEGVRS